MTTLNYRAGSGVRVDLEKLIASRMLIQANSGGGKSRAIRQLLEETHGKVQHLVIDPEGEFATLREKFDYVLAAKTGGDVIASPKLARMLCRKLVELGASAVLDLYDLPIGDRREFVKLFLAELMSLPRSLWRPIIVVIDEAHAFAPERGSGESQSTDAVINLCSQGRKRGFCPILATQRISKLHKDAAAELLNKLVGRTHLDVDVKRAADELGFNKEQGQQLKRLEPGQFFVYGPACPGDVTLVRTGNVITSHPEAGRVGAAAPPAPAKVKAMLSQLGDLPKEAEEEARTLADQQRVIRDLQIQIRKLERDGKTVEKTVTVVDQAAVDRAVAAAVKPYQNGLVTIKNNLFRAAQAMEAGHAAADQHIDQLLKIEPKNALPARTQRVASTAEVPRATERQSMAPRVKSGETRSDSRANSNGDLSGPEQRIVDAIAWQESIGIDEPSQVAVAFLANYTYGAGSFNNARGSLRQKGYVEYLAGDRIRLTDEGREHANAPATAPTNAELHARVLSVIGGPEQRLLRPLLDAWPESISNEDLARAANYAPGAGSYNNPRGRLRTLGLVEYVNGGVRAADLLFPEDRR